uniref:Hypoxia up-regulated protein 1 n=1 Tax=Panagrolaimus davidi TaxID=227884 RepID=A0A914P9Q0_9BILA
MVLLHVGLESFSNNACVFDSDNEQLRSLTIESIFKIENVKTDINDEYGCLCLCCSSEDSNESRKNFIKYAIQCGFENIEIIDELTALFFNALSGSTYKQSTNDLIYIIHNQKCFIWLKKEFETQLIKVVDEKDYVNLDNLIGEMVSDMGLKIHSHILMNDNSVDETVFKKLFIDFQYFNYTFESLAKGALTKALIMADNSLADISDVSTSLQRAFEIFIGKKRIMFFDFYQRLPFQESVELKNYKKNRILYILQEKNLSDYNEYEFRNVIGIDLGTARCFAACVRQSGIEIFDLDNISKRQLQSYVSFDEKTVKCGEVVVGRMRNCAKSTVYDCKRIIGKEFNEIKKEKSLWEFEIVNHNGYIQLEVEDCGKKTLKYPEEMFAALLKHIKQKATEFQGKELHEVVISCSVSFTKSQKDAIYISAMLAGWKKINLVTDSMASLLSYFYGQSIKKNTLLLVFDLGGGNLDVSVVEVGENNHLLMHLQGITDMGGRDFDHILFEYFKDKLNTKFNILVEKGSKYENKIHKLLLECEEIKCALSEVEHTDLAVDSYDPSSDEFITITREEFEILSVGLLKKIKKMIIENLYSYECNAARIDKVLQLGGGCRMPMIQKLIKETFTNAEILAAKNPEEMVALGAVQMVAIVNNF